MAQPGRRSLHGLSFGLGYPVGHYKVDFYAGISVLQTTRVAQSDTGFPGTYDADNGYSFGIQFTRVWRGAERSTRRGEARGASAPAQMHVHMKSSDLNLIRI